MTSRFSISTFVVMTIFNLSAHAAEPSPLDYRGSSFNEVMHVIQDKNVDPMTQKELEEMNIYRHGVLPQYEVSGRSLGLIALTRASKKTLRQKVDYYDRIEKMVHANGVCVSGQWSITENSNYTGYFKPGSRGLFIGRLSVALQETTSLGNRGFGFAGKIFPTMNADEVVPTTNFFTVDVLSGTNAKRFFDVALTNNPPLVFERSLLGVLSKIVPAFLQADSSPTFRPITPIAQTGETGPIQSPIYMRLRTADFIVKNDSTDFRTEVLKAMEQNNQRLVFNIEVSSETNDRLATEGWTKLGQITINQADVSYGCDRRLHFAHPKDDKSDKKN